MLGQWLKKSVLLFSSNCERKVVQKFLSLIFRNPFFREWKEKFNMTDDEENDTLTFNMKSTLIFRSDLTKGLTMHDLITTVHPLIMVCW